jgi:uncharacterized protein YdhG (YjbR/CyaY superfamily)
MKTRPDVAKDIDAYIAAAPEHTRAILQKVRRAVAKAAPGAQEAIRYAIPTFTLQRNLVHFAGYDKHIGLYPVPRAARDEPKILAYASGKGTLRFPLSEPIPYTLISEVVRLLVKEHVSVRPASAALEGAPRKKASAKVGKKRKAAKKARAR